ncbi:hypothetical protein JHK87_010057 [Glycine soja]|nr:hypothetical protein JHK87_010057 [Glycine soja]
MRHYVLYITLEVEATIASVKEEITDRKCELIHVNDLLSRVIEAQEKCPKLMENQNFQTLSPYVSSVHSLLVFSGLPPSIALHSHSNPPWKTPQIPTTTTTITTNTPKLSATSISYTQSTTKPSFISLFTPCTTTPPTYILKDISLTALPS